MDFEIDIGPGLGPVTTPTPDISGDSAGDTARTELSKILSDPTHPHYHGLKRGDSVANSYVDALYKKAYPGQAELHEHASASTGEPNDPPADPALMQAITELQNEQGPAFPVYAADLQFGLQRLSHTFGGEVDDFLAAAEAAGIGHKQQFAFLNYYGRQARNYAP